MPDQVPTSLEIRHGENPTLRTGDSLHVTQTVTVGDGLPTTVAASSAWVQRADGALEHYPDAFLTCFE